MNKKLTNKGWHQFLKLCTQFKTEKQFDELFNLFLTIEEKKALTTRYQIVKALLEGKETQRKISKRFGVSIAKITRGSNQLKTIGEKFRKFLQDYFC